MKKLLITMFVALAMGLGVAANAATITLVNKYNQPVYFAVSQSSLYNPVWLGIVRAGDRVTVKIPGVITPDFQFMAYPPFQTSIVYGCGHTIFNVNSVKVVAGMGPFGGDFGCALVTKRAIIFPKQ